MLRTRWHTQIWPTPRVARGKARNDVIERVVEEICPGPQAPHHSSPEIVADPGADRTVVNSIPLSGTEPPANAGDDSLEHQNLELPSPPVYA